MHSFRSVSVIIPAFNEEQTIVKCIESLINGDYPLDLLEFVVADGGSVDKTLEEIGEFQNKNPQLDVKVVNNPLRSQGYGLNIAIDNVSTSSEIIVRADAHSIYPRNYIYDCVNTLLTNQADNAGGVMFPVGKTPFQKAVAFSMTHPLGVGNAKFHLGNYSDFVDTVYLGCFRKEIFKEVGLFDPMMTPNEDAELNLRIIKCGGKIYLNSDIKVEYFPRRSIKELLVQYFRYGCGRCRTVKKHGRITSYRQIVSPLWVMSSLVFIGMGMASKLFFIPVAVYLSIIFLISIIGTLKSKDMSILMSSVCFIIMHYAWGIGFINEIAKNSNPSGVPRL